MQIVLTFQIFTGIVSKGHGITCRTNYIGNEGGAWIMIERVDIE